MTKDEKSARWKLVRISAQAKEIRRIGNEYLKRLKNIKELYLVEKEHKKGKASKGISFARKCKIWVGPVRDKP